MVDPPTWSVVAKFGGEENILLASPAAGRRLHHACFNPDKARQKKVVLMLDFTWRLASLCSSHPAGT